MIDTNYFENDEDVENPRSVARLLGIITGECDLGPKREEPDIIVPEDVGVWDARRETYIVVHLNDLTPREAYAFGKYEDTVEPYNLY